MCWRAIFEQRRRQDAKNDGKIPMRGPFSSSRLPAFAVVFMRNLTLPVLCLAALCVSRADAGAKTVVKEYDRVFTTYPYSDPDPVPAIPPRYPYRRDEQYKAPAQG